jgi:hypothetical protein
VLDVGPCLTSLLGGRMLRARHEGDAQSEIEFC